MMMRGDINKMIVEVNKVMEGAFKRIEALEDRLMGLELPMQPPELGKRGVGRPPGSKNKPKAVASEAKAA